MGIGKSQGYGVILQKTLIGRVGVAVGGYYSNKELQGTIGLSIDL